MLAQIETALAGNTGWVGLGLLGLVMFWLLYSHLPSKDKQQQVWMDGKDKIINDMIASKDAALLAANTRHDLHMTTVIDKFDRTTNNLSITFKESLQQVTEHCKEEIEQITKEVIERLKKNG